MKLKAVVNMMPIEFMRLQDENPREKYLYNEDGDCRTYVKIGGISTDRVAPQLLTSPRPATYVIELKECLGFVRYRMDLDVRFGWSFFHILAISEDPCDYDKAFGKLHNIMLRYMYQQGFIS